MTNEKTQREQEQATAQVQSASQARQAASYLAAGDRLSATVRHLQCELVAQWLGEYDQDERERCWHECRALEATHTQLLVGLDDALGHGRHEISTADMALVERLTDALWKGAERWLPGIVKWKRAHG